jgi:hypothetical protein
MNENEADLESLLELLRPKGNSSLQKHWTPGRWKSYGFMDGPVTIEPNFVILEQI